MTCGPRVDSRIIRKNRAIHKVKPAVRGTFHRSRAAAEV